MTRLIYIALSAFVAAAAFAAPASARWYGEDNYNRGYAAPQHDRNWNNNGYYYRAPPVVYSPPSRYYYPPPVVYGPEVGFPGLSIQIH